MIEHVERSSHPVRIPTKSMARSVHQQTFSNYGFAMSETKRSYQRKSVNNHHQKYAKRKHEMPTIKTLNRSNSTISSSKYSQVCRNSSKSIPAERSSSDSIETDALLSPRYNSKDTDVYHKNNLNDSRFQNLSSSCYFESNKLKSNRCKSATSHSSRNAPKTDLLRRRQMNTSEEFIQTLFTDDNEENFIDKSQSTDALNIGQNLNNIRQNTKKPHVMTQPSNLLHNPSTSFNFNSNAISMSQYIYNNSLCATSLQNTSCYQCPYSQSPNETITNLNHNPSSNGCIDTMKYYFYNNFPNMDQLSVQSKSVDDVRYAQQKTPYHLVLNPVAGDFSILFCNNKVFRLPQNVNDEYDY